MCRLPVAGRRGVDVACAIEALKAAFDDLAAAVVGANERGIHAIMARLDERQEGAAPLKASIECALYDLLARSVGLPLHDPYGGRLHTSFANARIVPLKSPEAMAAVAAGLARDRFEFLKV